MSRCMISACGRRGSPNSFSMRSEKVARQFDGAVGQHLHALIAAERLEILRSKLEAAILRLTILLISSR
jgi:hypothetical protein